eukprot:scaffold26.g3348.t1
MSDRSSEEGASRRRICSHINALPDATALQETLVARWQERKACSPDLPTHLAAHGRQLVAGHQVVLDLATCELFCIACADYVFSPEFDALASAARAAVLFPAACGAPPPPPAPASGGGGPVLRSHSQPLSPRSPRSPAGGMPHGLCPGEWPWPEAAPDAGGTAGREEAEAARRLLASGRFRAVSQDRFPAGLRGLNNMALLHAPLLSAHFLLDRHPRADCAISRDGGTCLNCELDAVFSAAYGGDRAPYSPAPLLHAWWQLAGSHLGGYKQQDAHEFLLFLLNMLASTQGADLVQARAWCRPCRPRRQRAQCSEFTLPLPTSSRPQAAFGGSLRSDVTCCSCGHTSSRQESFSHLSLDIPLPSAFSIPPTGAAADFAAAAAAAPAARAAPGGGSGGSSRTASPSKSAAARRAAGGVGGQAGMPPAADGVERDARGRPLAGAAKASRAKALAAAATAAARAGGALQQQPPEGSGINGAGPGLASTGVTGQLAAQLAVSGDGFLAANTAAATCPETASGIADGCSGALVVDDTEDTLSSPRSRPIAPSAPSAAANGASSPSAVGLPPSGRPLACPVAPGLPPIPPARRAGGKAAAPDKQQQQRRQAAQHSGSSGSLSAAAWDAAAASTHIPSTQVPAAGTVAAMVGLHPELVGFYRWPGPSLVGCLHRFTREERLGPGELWVCGRCRTQQPGLKQLSLRRLPPLLVLHAKRFEHTGGFLSDTAKKLDTYLAFPLADLDMRPHLTSSVLRARYGLRPPAPVAGGAAGGAAGAADAQWQRRQQQQRRQQALAEQQAGAAARRRARSGSLGGPPSPAAAPGSPAAGEAAQPPAEGAQRPQERASPPRASDFLYDLYAVGGHYVAYVHCEDGRWYLCDDAWVVAVDEDHVRNCQAYLLFYAQKPLLRLAGGTGGTAGPASEAAQFTLLVMTTAARLVPLRTVLAHYARCCPSLAEVVLVWNGGPPPAPGRDLPPLRVPFRVRAEANNSLNNRFRPDPQLKARAVLHMDDDILVRCSDVEHGFRAWQARPDALVGYFPRLLLPGGSGSSAAGGGGGDALANGAGAAGGQPLQYLGEREVFARGAYDAILTGAAFLDAPLAAELYWGEGNAEGRAAVDRRSLGCANLSCNLCKLSQRRRCEANFAPKYLAPCDVIEAKCGAQIYVVVVDPASGELVSAGLDDAFLQISIIDGRRFEHEGERDDALEECQLLLNKQGQPLLAHGRSGAYTDGKRMLVPMIHGQAILPDLKVTNSSEALLQGRAPPFRLLVRAVRRGGASIPNISHALSEPFVVATARVKGAAKLEIPHVEDHVSKIECVGVQTQKKLEDIRGASTAAGVPDLGIPINSVTKAVGQFRDLVEMVESNKALRETLKQVLRLTKGWDVARDHVRRAVETDVQLRVFNPDGCTDVGLVFKCGTFNVVEMHRPELVDIIWLPLNPAAHPDAVKKLLPQASTAWRTAGHPGWQFLPLTTAHLPTYRDGGQPANLFNSFTLTVQPAAPPSGGAAAPGLAGLALPGGVPQGLVGAAGFDPAGAAASSGGLPVGGQAVRGPTPGSGGLSAAMTNSLMLCGPPPLGGPDGLSGLAGLPGLQQPGVGLGGMVGLFAPAPGSGGAGLLPGDLLAPGSGGVDGVGVGGAGGGGGPLCALQPQASAASVSTGHATADAGRRLGVSERRQPLSL